MATVKTAELTGSLLDYWTARAEGVPADELRIHTIGALLGSPSDFSICVRRIGHLALLRLDYSTNWAMTGPLVEKHMLGLVCQPYRCWSAAEPDSIDIDGPTAMIAVCRTVVRAVFGDEVEDLP